MQSFIRAGEAYVLAQIGQQQIAAALAAELGRFVRRLLGRVRHDVPAGTAQRG